MASHYTSANLRIRVLSERILELGGQVLSYVRNPNKERPLCIFLHAPPGSGKSFLVEHLAKHIDASLSRAESCRIQFRSNHELNLTQFDSYDDLTKRVSSVLSSAKRTRLARGADMTVPVLFFDELDSQVGPWQPFQRFLVPMWEGRFRPKECKYKLGKCVFVFAASLKVLPDERLAQLVAHYIAKARFRWHHYSLSKTSQHSALYGIRTFKREDQWLAWRDSQLNAFKAQDDIEKCRDFFDRIDHFISIPSSLDYFRYRDNDEVRRAFTSLTEKTSTSSWG